MSFEIWVDRIELFYVTALYQILPILCSANSKLAIYFSCYIYYQIFKTCTWFKT